MQRAYRPGLEFGFAPWWCVCLLTAALAQTGAGVGFLGAQDTIAHRPTTPDASRSESQTSGPLFFTDTAADGRWVDAHDAPVLRRRVSITLIGVPLGAALEGICEQAGVGLSYTPELLPLGARISIKADSATLVAVLAQALVNAGQDVLVSAGGDLRLVPHSVVAEAADSSRVVTGAVLDVANGEPVPYATVALLGTDHARFADSAGHFRLARLRPRAYRLRARQIGYEPVDTTVVVGPGPTVVTVTLRMHRVPALLGAVTITARGAKGCVSTGIPDPRVDPSLAAIFEQVRENVDRTRLLSEQYPFRYTREERRIIRRSPGGDSTDYIDSLSYESRARRPYQVGDVVFYRLDTVFHRSGPGEVPRPIVRRHMYLPVFTDLADSAFLQAHCFTLGALERDRDGPTMFRVDFEPAARIRTPDVQGSIYIDARQLLVRRAFFAITRPNAAKPPLINFAVTTTFRPIIPLVPLVDSMGSQQLVGAANAGADPSNAVSRLALTTDRMIKVAFETESPGARVGPANVTASEATGREPSPDSSATRADRAGITHVRAFFPPDPSCKLDAPADTIAELVYATLDGPRPAGMRQDAWSQYVSDVLSALRRSFVLPSDLILQAFSWPFPVSISESVVRDGRGVADALEDSDHVTMPGPMPRPSGDSSGALVGVVMGEGEGEGEGPRRPLPFASVWLAGESERVTDTGGIWRATRLVPGSYGVRVRQVGFAVKDTVLTVRSGPSATVDTVWLTRRSTRSGAMLGKGGRLALYVAPTLSTTVELTLGANGSVQDVHLIASSSSGTADALVLAAIERAASRHAFPVIDSTGERPRLVTFDLVVSMDQPSTVAGIALGRVEEPAWPWQHEAALNKRLRQPNFFGNVAAGDPAADTANFEFVVDARGRALPLTARTIRTGSEAARRAPNSRLETRVLQSLSRFYFTPAVVANCPVSQLIRQGFGYSIRPDSAR